jgi:hypothetical protein
MIIAGITCQHQQGEIMSNLTPFPRPLPDRVNDTPQEFSDNVDRYLSHINVNISEQDAWMTDAHNIESNVQTLTSEAQTAATEAEGYKNEAVAAEDNIRALINNPFHMDSGDTVALVADQFFTFNVTPSGAAIDFGHIVLLQSIDGAVIARGVVLGRTDAILTVKVLTTNSEESKTGWWIDSISKYNEVAALEWVQNQILATGTWTAPYTGRVYAIVVGGGSNSSYLNDGVTYRLYGGCGGAYCKVGIEVVSGQVYNLTIGGVGGNTIFEGNGVRVEAGGATEDTPGSIIEITGVAETVYQYSGGRRGVAYSNTATQDQGGYTAHGYGGASKGCPENYNQPQGTAGGGASYGDGGCMSRGDPVAGSGGGAWSVGSGTSGSPTTHPGAQGCIVMETVQ